MISNKPLSHSRHFSLFISMILLVLLLVGCDIPLLSDATAVPPTPTTIPEVDTPVLISSSPTPEVQAPQDMPTIVLFSSPTPVLQILDTPTLDLSTATPLLLATAINIPSNTPALSPGSPGEIVFQEGETAAVLKGTISPGQVITYTVQAIRAQPMILNVESPGWDVTLGVIAPDGGRLFDEVVGWTSYQIQLPQTGTYTIKLFGGATTEDYVLTTKIGKLVNFPNTYQTSITLYGQTNLGYVHTYGFRCTAGQLMTVSLNVDSSRAYLSVFGIQGSTLVSQWDRATTWIGTLPTTQEYVVEVIPRDGGLVTYILTVTIP